MSDPFIESHLGNLPVFAQLTPDQLDLVADATAIIQFEPGQSVFRQGDVARGLYKFVSGSAQLVRTQDGVEQTIGVVGPNQYLNDRALTQAMRETASLRVFQPAVVLLVEREALAQVVAAHPDMQSRLPFRVAPPSTPPRPAQPPAAKPRPQVPPPGQASMPPRQTQAAAGGAPAIQPEPLRRTPGMTSDAPRKAFRSQRDDESVLLDFRRHWWSWVGRVWVPALFLILMVTLSILVSSALLALTFMGLGVVVGGLSMLFFYLEWANDHVIVTDQRIVRINRTILTLRTNISEIPLGSIQEVNADEYTRDPFSRVFHFGRVELRTAGDGGNIILSHIPRPSYVQSLIFRNQEQHKQTMNRDQRDQIRQDIDRIVSGRDSGPQEMPVNNLDAPEKRSLLGKTTFTTSEGEIIHRRHWLRWLKLTFWPMMLMLVSLAGSVGSLAIGLGVVGLALGGFGFLVGVLWFFWSDWDWRHDTYIIGRETVRIVHKRPLWLQNESDQVLINRIDNVVSERGGIFQSVFNFGNVRLSLIGSDAGDAKVLRFVPDPQAVQAEITRRQDAMQRRNREEEERQRREEIAEYLSVYHDTVGPSGGTAPAGYSQGAEPGGSGSGRGMRPPNVPRRRGDSS